MCIRDSPTTNADVIEGAVRSSSNVDTLGNARKKIIHASDIVVRIENGAHDSAGVIIAPKEVPPIRRWKRCAVIKTSARNAAAQIKRRGSAAAARLIRPSL